MKFLVIWHLDVSRPTPEVIKAVMEQPNYGKKLQADKKLECRAITLWAVMAARGSTT